jgi:hypothetical protein
MIFEDAWFFSLVEHPFLSYNMMGIAIKPVEILCI